MSASIETLRDTSLTVRNVRGVLETFFRRLLSIKDATIKQRIQTVYWLVKEEVANRKLASLQELIDTVGNNPVLRDFKHVSSTAISGFLLLISDQITDETMEMIKKAGVYATMFDESTDVAHKSQYITFVRFVDNLGQPVIRFLDLRSLGAGGGTAENLTRTWVEVAEDYDLDKERHICLGCDGASSCIGRSKSHSVLLKSNDKCPSMISIHCYAHRLALACCDTKTSLKQLTAFESVLLVTRRFFSMSHLNTGGCLKNA